MKVKYLGESNIFAFLHGKVYVVESIECNLYRMVDETDDDYLYGTKNFEIIEEVDEHYKQMVDDMHVKPGDKVRVITDEMCSLDKGRVYEVVETKGEWIGIRKRIITWLKEEGSNEYNKKSHEYVTDYYHPDLFEVVK